MILDSALEFFKKSIIDNELDGIFPSVDSNGVDAACTDKRLFDQAVGLLAMSYCNDESSAANCANALKHLKSSTFPGYDELSDRSWNLHGSARVRTLKTQYLTALSLLEYGIRFKSSDSIDEGLKLIDACLSVQPDNGMPCIVSEDWKTIIDDRRDVKTAAIAVIALVKAIEVEKHDKYLSSLSKFTNQLDLFIDKDHGGAFEMISPNGKVLTSFGKRCGSMALCALSLSLVSKISGDEKLVKKASDQLSFIYEHMQHPLFGGFWNMCTADGNARVDSLGGYYNGYSPFPASLASDHALLVISAISLFKITKNEQINKLLQTSIIALDNFSDKCNGGFFVGETSWFSTPADPTVPLGRYYSVSAHTPGAFYAGNVLYLPMQQKQAETQALALISVSYYLKEHMEIPKGDCNSSINSDKYNYKESKNDRRFSNMLVKPLSKTNLHVNIKKYSNWLFSAKNADGFGLTNHRAPLDFTRDRLSLVFSTHHALADLTILGTELNNKKAIIDSISSCQRPEGGFGDLQGHPCDVFTTYCGVLSIHMLNGQPSDPDKCIEYLQSCQNPDGGFGLVPGYRSDLWHTNLAVASLSALDAKPKNIEACLNFVMSCYNGDGSFSINPIAPPETFSAYRAASTFYILEKQFPVGEKTVKWIKNCQAEDGGFYYRPGKAESFVGTYHAIAGLYLLDSAPDDVDLCRNWMALHQNPDGGFARSIGGPSQTTDEGFTCLQSIYILEKSLSKYWAAMIN